MEAIKSFWFNDCDKVPYKANSYAKEYYPKPEAVAEIARLEAEVERYKAALEEIETHHVSDYDDASDMAQIANQALSGGR